MSSTRWGDAQDVVEVLDSLDLSTSPDTNLLSFTPFLVWSTVNQSIVYYQSFLKRFLKTMTTCFFYIRTN